MYLAILYIGTVSLCVCMCVCACVCVHLEVFVFGLLVLRSKCISTIEQLQ